MDLVDGDDKNSIKDNHADGEVNSPPPGQGQSVSPAKGFGLKKWKRIKRLSPNNKDKDVAAPVEDKLFLKRNLSGSTTPTKPLRFSSAEINPPSTTDDLFRSLATVSGSSLDSRLAVEASESDNSEDRSSRSSTAASVPKVGQEKNRMKNLIAKNVASSNGGVRKGIADNSKKHRGERNKLDEENSQSSLESDSRSSNFVFAQGATSNGGKSVSYGGENSGETYTSQQMFNDEVQTAYGKENVSEIDKKNHQGSPIHDPLVESIRAFQSVQEALEKEVHKLGAIGKDSASLDAGFMESCEPSSSDQLASETIGEKTSVLTMTQKVKYLESRLEEANAVLSQKEARIAEMEAIVNRDKLPESVRETLREMELEFESLFQQKMEAEIEYLALTRATQKKSVFEGHTLEEVENKTAMLKKEAEKVEKYLQDIKGTEEIMKIRSRMWKISFCFFVQLILLLLVFMLFAIELDPQSEVVVPT